LPLLTGSLCRTGISGTDIGESRVRTGLRRSAEKSGVQACSAHRIEASGVGITGVREAGVDFCPRRESRVLTPTALRKPALTLPELPNLVFESPALKLPESKNPKLPVPALVAPTLALSPLQNR
jgi:hypothetical protein